MNRKDERPPAPSSRRRRNVGIGAIAAIVAFMVGVILYRWPLQRTPPLPVTPIISQDSAAKDLRAMTPAVNIPAPIAGMPGGIEVCGMGTVTLDIHDPSAVNRYSSSLAKRASARWRSALLDSDDYRARAVGLFLQAIGDGSRDELAEQPGDTLVQLAVQTRDPAVYAIALRICRAPSDTATLGACQQISPGEWARIDPDNATPWLSLAGLAATKNDVAAEADAFNEAAKAHRSDSYGHSLYAFARADMPGDLTPLERMLLAEQMIGYEAAWPEPQYSVALHHCSVEAMHDDKQRQACDSLAELLVSKGETRLDLGVGRKLGERVGWSKDRLNAIAQEQNALMQVISFDDTNPWACSNVQRVDNYFTQVALLGELGAARDALARSGETVQDLAQKQIAAQAEANRAAPQEHAASAASAP